ncbi:cyclin-D1-binding protein 1 homolog [Latimeria chalumnae]|uniref:Cyclin D1 binding protein 1 n=1 Tax=Latimeria chalumnae TaxID=7897 RepID=H3AWJ8_LATCH|nr:PREDICTED: cyclin-D1-binding protein 1 [Latimeria chalumnae]|eukprot:XP_006003203.1 PREDICTED: cyclin-D1-binding protein 1 [Latimeria chalumnae]
MDSGSRAGEGSAEAELNHLGPSGDVRVSLRNLSDTVRCILSRVKDGESKESNEDFNPQHFWETLGQVFKAASQEATKLSLAFSKPPLPTLQDCERLCEGIQKTVLAVASTYYLLPKSQGITLRRIIRDATVDVLNGIVQLIEIVSKTPLQSLSQEQLKSTGGVWEACDQIVKLPKDNQAAVLSVMLSNTGIVKDALEEMEQLQEGDPFSDILDDDEAEARGNRDTYWSEADRQLMAQCLGLIKASKACLKKVSGAVKGHGKVDTPEHIAQLDDLADIGNEISPNVDELALSLYPPVNYPVVRFNAARLASVLKKTLEIAKPSHICPEAEMGWVQFLNGAIDHNIDKIKDLTQSAV